MVNLEAVKSVAPKLLLAGKQWIIDSLNQHHQSLNEKSNVAGTDEVNKQIQTASTEYLVHHWLEAMFAWFQVVVLWHEPYVSVCALSGLLSSFL